MVRGRIKQCTLVLVLVGVIVISLAFFFCLRPARAARACIQNLRIIDGAKFQWALEYHQGPNATPGWNDIRPYQGRRENEIAFLKCPGGGAYTIGRVGEAPTC